MVGRGRRCPPSRRAGGAAPGSRGLWRRRLGLHGRTAAWLMVRVPLLGHLPVRARCPGRRRPRQGVGAGTGGRHRQGTRPSTHRGHRSGSRRRPCSLSCRRSRHHRLRHPGLHPTVGARRRSGPTRSPGVLQGPGPPGGVRQAGGSSGGWFLPPCSTRPSRYRGGADRDPRHQQLHARDRRLLDWTRNLRHHARAQAAKVGQSSAPISPKPPPCSPPTPPSRSPPTTRPTSSSGPPTRSGSCRSERSAPARWRQRRPKASRCSSRSALPAPKPSCLIAWSRAPPRCASSGSLTGLLSHPIPHSVADASSRSA